MRHQRHLRHYSNHKHCFSFSLIIASTNAKFLNKSVLLFRCKKFLLHKSKKRRNSVCGLSNDASDADDASFMGVKLFVTCVICVILNFFEKLFKMCWQFLMMCYNQNTKNKCSGGWLVEKCQSKEKLNGAWGALRATHPYNRDCKWPGIRYWEYLQICRCFWYLMSGFFVFYVHFFKINSY